MVVRLRVLVVFVALFMVMVLCASGWVWVTTVGDPGKTILAEKLSHTPERYVVLTDLDPVMLKAITTLKSVRFGSYDQTEFDELVGDKHGAVNVEYQGNYYFVGSPNVTPSGRYILIAWVSLIGFITSATLLVVLAIREALRWKKHKDRLVRQGAFRLLYFSNKIGILISENKPIMVNWSD